MKKKKEERKGNGNREQNTKRKGEKNEKVEKRR